MSKRENCSDISQEIHKVDLHIHTTASDGIMPPVEVVLKAKEKGLLAVAITDHDTTLGLEEVQKSKSLRKDIQDIEIVPGIELSTSFEGEEFHIIGYYIDPGNKFLISELKKFSNIREKRVRSILERLNDIGIELSYHEVKNSSKEGTIGRPHIARMMVEKGYTQNETQAFEEYLNPSRPGYVAREKVTPKRAIDLIKDSGGLAFWAHPSLSSTRSPWLLEKFIQWGIQGIEINHPDQQEDLIRQYWKEKAQENGLLVSGGTDYHGYEEHPIEIGEISLPYSCFHEIKKKAKNYRI